MILTLKFGNILMKYFTIITFNYNVVTIIDLSNYNCIIVLQKKKPNIAC